MLAFSLFISFLKTVNPFDLRVQVFFFFPSTGKLPPTKSLIFAFLPLTLLFTLGIQLIQRWDIRFLAYMCIVFFLIISVLPLIPPQSYCIYLVNHLHYQSIFFPIVDLCFLVPPMCILILLLFLTSWHSSSLPASFFFF